MSHRHAAPTTWRQRVADVLHRMLTRRRPAVGIGRHVYRARPTRTAAADRMILAGGLTGRVRAERLERAALAMLRTECERLATLLDGAHRGHQVAQHVTMRAALKRETARLMHSARVRTRPARQRFTAAAGHTRVAARETAAVAARAARQVGAHRHVGAATRAGHDLATTALAGLKAYERTRAAGERPWWQQGMRTA